MQLVRDAIRAGIFNDLGSGSNVDVTVIRKDDVSRFRTYEVAAVSVFVCVLVCACVCVEIVFEYRQAGWWESWADL